MADDFNSVISALWARLRLGAPTLDDSRSVTMSVDNFDVMLSESPDGQGLVLWAIAGRLAPDFHRRDEQVRTLLKTNLGMLQSNGAGLRLESSGETATVRVEAAYPYAAKNLDRLVSLIEDVLYRAEFHAPDLAATAAPRPALRAVQNDLSPETFIFRP